MHLRFACRTGDDHPAPKRRQPLAQLAVIDPIACDDALGAEPVLEIDFGARRILGIELDFDRQIVRDRLAIEVIRDALNELDKALGPASTTLALANASSCSRVRSETPAGGRALHETLRRSRLLNPIAPTPASSVGEIRQYRDQRAFTGLAQRFPERTVRHSLHPLRARVPSASALHQRRSARPTKNCARIAPELPRVRHQSRRRRRRAGSVPHAHRCAGAAPRAPHPSSASCWCRYLRREPERR